MLAFLTTAALPTCLLTAMPEEQLSGGDRGSVAGTDASAPDAAALDQAAAQDRALPDGAGESGSDAWVDSGADGGPSDAIQDLVAADAIQDRAAPDAVPLDGGADAAQQDAAAGDRGGDDAVEPDAAGGPDAAAPDSARVGEPVEIVNGDFEANAEKTWFWDWDGRRGTGELVPGAIPGWSTDEDPGIGGYSGKGDSGVEPGGNPGMRLFLNSVDWDVYQTTAHAIAAGDAYRLDWDMLGTYAASPEGSCVVVATLYYLDGSDRVTIESTTVTEPQNTVYIPYSFELDAVPAQAVGKPIGLSFDNITDQIDLGAQTWVGIDNVTLTVFR